MGGFGSGQAAQQAQVHRAQEVRPVGAGMRLEGCARQFVIDQAKGVSRKAHGEFGVRVQQRLSGVGAQCPKAAFQRGGVEHAEVRVDLSAMGIVEQGGGQAP